MKSERTAKITKVTPKWVRDNGTHVPIDGLEAAKLGSAQVYDTPLGRFRVDAAGRITSMEVPPS